MSSCGEKMKNFNTRAISLILPALLCGTAHAASINFTVANEGVKLFEVVKENTVKKYQEVVAPWKIEIKKDESRLFVFEKAGYVPVFVPLYFEPSKDIEINIALKKMDSETKSQISTPALVLADELVDQIIFTQSLVDEKKYVEALNQAEQLYTAHPQSVSVKVLYGNALIMNKQFQKADSIYASALVNLPEGKDAIRKSIEALRKKFHSSRVPASGGAE